MLYIGLNKEKHEKIFLSETIRPRAIYLAVASPRGLCPWGQKWPRPEGHIFYIGLYRENIEKKFLSENHKAESLPSLFKLCPCCQNGPAPGSPGTWSAFYRYLYVSFKQNSCESFRATGPSCFLYLFSSRDSLDPVYTGSEVLNWI